MTPDICTKRRSDWSEKPDDLSMPPPPQAAYFDPAVEAWVLSRYTDVVAALQDSRLLAMGHKRRDQEGTDADTRTLIRSEIQRTLSAPLMSEWQSKIGQLAHSKIAALPVDRPMDLVSEFAEPWCMDVAIIVTRADAKDRERLIELARLVSAAAADPDDPDLKDAAAVASSELEIRLPSRAIPMAGAAFVALAQTLPGFLARAWLALLRYPSELSRLCASPGLMPAAVEELLRYAGLARRITRIAQSSLNLGGTQIGMGQRVKLELNTANRDPEQFVEPNRLDLRRGSVRHLALGGGPHACAGAPLIRRASEVATSAFVQTFHSVTVCEPVEWRGGAAFRAPARLLIRFRGSVHTAI